MSNRGQVYNYSAILRERVEELIALFGQLQTLRRRLQAANARRFGRRIPKAARRRRVLRR